MLVQGFQSAPAHQRRFESGRVTAACGGTCKAPAPGGPGRVCPPPGSIWHQGCLSCSQRLTRAAKSAVGRRICVSCFGPRPEVSHAAAHCVLTPQCSSKASTVFIYIPTSSSKSTWRHCRRCTRRPPAASQPGPAPASSDGRPVQRRGRACKSPHPPTGTRAPPPRPCPPRRTPPRPPCAPCGAPSRQKSWCCFTTRQAQGNCSGRCASSWDAARPSSGLPVGLGAVSKRSVHTRLRPSKLPGTRRHGRAPSPPPQGAAFGLRPAQRLALPPPPAASHASAALQLQPGCCPAVAACVQPAQTRRRADSPRPRAAANGGANGLENGQPLRVPL